MSKAVLQDSGNFEQVDIQKELMKPVITGIPAMQSWLIEQACNMREKVLREVMAKCLGRPAELSDCGRFSLVIHQRHPGREFIGFDGNMIGEIRYFDRQEDFKWIAGYEFIPKTKIDNAG